MWDDHIYLPICSLNNPTVTALLQWYLHALIKLLPISLGIYLHLLHGGNDYLIVFPIVHLTG